MTSNDANNTQNLINDDHAREHVLKHSKKPSKEYQTVNGVNFEKDVTLQDIINGYRTSGFQATNLAKACNIVEKMYSWRLSHDPIENDEKNNTVIKATHELEYYTKYNIDEFDWKLDIVRENTRATIFLSYTSNMISSGLRECFLFLAKYKLIDVIATSAGGIEEDFIRCLGTFIIGDFHKIKGPELRNDGWNRIGNIYVPNDNYVLFEQWINPILDQMLIEQETQNVKWTPSKFIHRLGKEINDERSVYYWCYKNNIPVFCPALTDGSIGDCLYFHFRDSTKKLRIDIIEDIIRLNESARTVKKSGIIILGGGMAKHQILNANLMRNGADFAVYINTAQEFDGCDSGASPDEAMSWGKLSSGSENVKISCDASIAFPIIVAGVIKKFQNERVVNLITRSPYFSQEQIFF